MEVEGRAGEGKGKMRSKCDPFTLQCKKDQLASPTRPSHLQVICDRLLQELLHEGRVHLHQSVGEAGVDHP